MRAAELKDTEYNLFYKTYILALDDIELLEGLQDGMTDLVGFLNSIPKNKFSHAYGEDKWTIAEVILHIIDTERVFQYRALCFSRNDKTTLPGFEQNDYVPSSNAKNRSKESLIKEYIAVRTSTIALYTSFAIDVLKRIGNANNSVMSVAAQGFVIAGHQAHHKRILEERYL